MSLSCLYTQAIIQQIFIKQYESGVQGFQAMSHKILMVHELCWATIGI